MFQNVVNKIVEAVAKSKVLKDEIDLIIGNLSKDSFE